MLLMTIEPDLARGVQAPLPIIFSTLVTSARVVGVSTVFWENQNQHTASFLERDETISARGGADDSSESSDNDSSHYSSYESGGGRIVLEFILGWLFDWPPWMHNVVAAAIFFPRQ